MPAISWNRHRAAHLFRRAGFGAVPEQVAASVAAGREASVDWLINYESVSTAELETFLASFGWDFLTYRSLADPDFEKAYQQFVDVRRWWVLRMAYSPRSLQEKLTLFWHNHFATSYAKVNVVTMLYNQNNLFRNLGSGKFETLLLAVAKDPAMLFFLDNNTNVKDAIQENWGRELLELFTMGVNRYTQADVRATAAAFTGWTTTFEPPFSFYFDRDRHLYGQKTLLGVTADLDGGDVISILARRPETAEYITNKLGRFFLGRNPRPALARQLHDEWLASEGNIKSILRIIFLSEDMEESASFSDQIKSPIEFMVSSIRGLGAFTDAQNLADIYAALSSQNLLVPPNVAGWPAYTYGGHRWFHTGAWFIRARFASDLASARPGYPSLWWDAEQFFRGGGSALGR